jgi:hypothetical protein
VALGRIASRFDTKIAHPFGLRNVVSARNAASDLDRTAERTVLVARSRHRGYTLRDIMPKCRNRPEQAELAANPSLPSFVDGPCGDSSRIGSV